MAGHSQGRLGTLASPSFRDRRSTKVSRPSGPPEGHELLREGPWEASCPTLPPRQTQGSQAYGPRPGHDALWPQPPASGPVLFLLLSAVYGLLLKETKPRSGFLQGPCSGSTLGAVRERQARPPIHGWALTFRLVSHVPVLYLQTPAHITGHPATAPMAFSQAEKITRSHLLFSRLTFFYVN